MIKLFHKDMILQSVLILVALFLLWGRALMAPVEMDAGEHPAILYSLICQWLTQTPRLAVIIAMLLALAQGITLNLLLANVNLVSQNSLLPTLLYLIATAVTASTLTPILLVNGIAIAMLYPLMLRGTLLTIPAEKVCGATMLAGVATLFYTPAIMLMLSYLLIALTYRLYNWKDWFLMLLGFAVPYILLILTLYMTDTLSDWWQTTTSSLENITLNLHKRDNTSGLLQNPWLSLVPAVVLLWSLGGTLGHLSEHTVIWQRNASTVMLFTVGGIGMLLYSTLLPLNMSLFAIPFSFCTYRMLSCAEANHTGFGRRKKHNWIYDLLLILIFVIAVIC